MSYSTEMIIFVDMKLIKINSNHYVAVDDSPKKENFYIPIGIKYLDDTNTIREPISEDIDYWSTRKDYYIITHSTQPLASMKELIGKGYDTILPINIDEVKELIGGDKDKKYTFNQITDAISMAREINGKESYYRYSMEEIVQSVEPKTSWEVEIVDGKLKIK